MKRKILLRGGKVVPDGDVSMQTQYLRCPCPEKRRLVERNDQLACANSDCPHAHDPERFKSFQGRPVLIAYKATDTLCTPTTNDLTERQFAGNPSKFMDWARRFVYGGSKTTQKNCSHFTQLLKQLNPCPSILVIGSGAKGRGAGALWDDTTLRKTGVDIYVSPTVDYVADAHFLPFADASFDGVWIQAVLEHVAAPMDVVEEIHRVLKPGGVVYAETPFMQQVHAGPYDFTRYTVTGHRFLFRDFCLIDMGGNGGPTQVLAWSIKYLVWSLTKSRKAGIAASLPFFIVARAIDPFIGENALWDVASGVFFLGAKGDGPPMPAKELPGHYRGLQR
jgi:SAM-dependent methyltransferase